jgi:hypothetical protein
VDQEQPWTKSEKTLCTCRHMKVFRPTQDSEEISSFDMSSSPTYYCNPAIELGRLSVSKGRTWFSLPVHVIIWSYDQLRDTLKSKDVLVCQFFLDILMSRMNPPQSVCIQNIMIIDMDTYYMLPRSKNLDMYVIKL